jgi:hypothetical protein
MCLFSMSWLPTYSTRASYTAVKPILHVCRDRGEVLQLLPPAVQLIQMLLALEGLLPRVSAFGVEYAFASASRF